MEVVQPTLELVSGILHSDFCSFDPPKIEDGGNVDDAFEHLRDEILGGVERLQLRDARLAKDELRDVLRRMRQKFQNHADSSQEELDVFNAKIRAGLESAQWTAKRCGVGGGGVGGGTTSTSSLKKSKPVAGDERLDTLKWLLVLEILKLLNVLTAWNSTVDLSSSASFTFFSPQKLQIVAKELRSGQRDCLKFLQEMNEEVVEVAKFLASKLSGVGVAPAKPIYKFSVDKKKMTVELFNVNFLVSQFWRLLKTFFGFAVGGMWKNEGLQIPEVAEETRLMGGDPFVIAMNLQEVVNHKRLDRILKREAKSRINSFNVNKDVDGIKAIRPRFLEGTDVEMVATQQSELVNAWMLTGSVVSLENVYLDDDAKDNIREMLQDLMLQWLSEDDADALRCVVDTVAVTPADVVVDVAIMPNEVKVGLGDKLGFLVQEWLESRDEASMQQAVDVFDLTGIQPNLDFGAAMKSGEIKREKLKVFLAELSSFYFETRESRVLDAICAVLNWIGDVSLIDKRETLNLKQNGGGAECSSVYGFDVELNPGLIIRRLDCDPEMAFRVSDDFWISDDAKKEKQWIQRNLNSTVSPIIFAMQAYLGCCAPRDFDVLGRIGADDEWKTLLAARDVSWRDEEWRFFRIKPEVEVKSVRIDVKSTAGGGWANKEFVQIRNIRMYAN